MTSEFLELLAEVDEGVYAVDMSQRIVFWNRGAERLLGLTANEALGKPCHQILGGASDDAGACSADCAAVLLARHGQVAPSRHLFTHTGDGEPRWLRVTHVLLPAARPELGTLVHIFHDTTHEVEAMRLFDRFRDLLSGPTQVGAPAADSALHSEGEGGRLSLREREIVGLLAQGLGTEAIAELLVVNSTTVRNHVQRILAKPGALPTGPPVAILAPWARNSLARHLD